MPLQQDIQDDDDARHSSVTPTYPRREQVAELTRLGQTLLLAGNVHWVVAEDSDTCSPLVAALLTRLGLPYTHITSPQPNIYKEAKLKYNPRGVSSRRAGLSWVMEHQPEGVIYFGDDDNTYDNYDGDTANNDLNDQCEQTHTSETNKHGGINCEL